MSSPKFYSVVNHHNWCQHFADPAKPDDGLFLFFFPNCTLNVYGGGMSSFRVCPTSDPSTTRMEFDYFNVDSGEKFEECSYTDGQSHSAVLNVC